MKRKNFIVAIIGRPNVGKSTLFNKLVGKRIAITTDVAGTTRDRIYEVVNWQGREFALVDTAGLEFSFEERLKEDIQSQIEIALTEADQIVFMVDGQTGITDLDQTAAEKLRKSNKEVILVANKVDNRNIEKELDVFYKLGFGEPIAISAINGSGTGDLLDRISAKLNPKEKEEEEKKEEITRLAILGRPNAGKSTLLNKLTGEERAIVSDIPGTTRDIVEEIIEHDGQKIAIVDTAGLRKRGKIGKTVSRKRIKEVGWIEKHSALRAFRIMEESDIALILIDGLEGITAQDQHIAGFAKDSGKGIILAVNKIDAEKGLNPQGFGHRLKREFEFIPFAPVVFISAKEGKNVETILDLVLQVAEQRKKKIPTPRLNSFLEKIILSHPPVGLSKKKPKLKYILQSGISPPTFTIFCSFPEKLHFSYKRFIENELRKTFDFSGTSIKIEFREKGSKKFGK